MAQPSTSPSQSKSGTSMLRGQRKILTPMRDLLVNLWAIHAMGLMVGRALSSVLWGAAADRYGRKPVILIGTFSVVIFNTLFGFSKSFWMALSMRFLLGIFNSLLGTIRAYASEVCREEPRALALSVVSTSRGIGLMIGPAIGGFLAQIFLCGAVSNRNDGGLGFSSQDVGEILAIADI